ncbi:MAG: PP2C family protein-serine/threonine phosphatase [Blastocatellales bacterium]
MLPRTILVKKTRWVWIALIALSPLAYVAGASLLFKYDPNLKVGFTIDRQSAIEAAARFAATKGIDVAGWNTLVRVSTDNNLLFYYRLDKGSESRIARSLAPEVVVGVRFKSPDGLDRLEVTLSPDARALGYKRNISRQRDVGSIAEPAARQMAVDAVKLKLAQHGISSDVDLKLEESSDAGVVNRKYTWKWPLTTIPELTLNSELSFRGGVMASDTLDADIDSKFARSALNSRSTLKIVFAIAYAILVAAVLIFSLYRFVQRVKQKEISYSRIALVTVIFAAVMSLFVLLTDVAVYDVGGQADNPVPDWMLTLIITFSATMSYVVIGLFMGLAYGSGEGDIRESYPGKLTSLDALVTGKLFSKNVSRSFLIGCAIGGWVAWLSNLALFPWQGKPGYGEEFGPLDPWFGYLPWLSALMVTPMDVILITVIGLLIPLPFLHRRFRSRRVIVGLSAIFVLLACAGPYLGFRPWFPILLMAVVRAFFFLLAFFYFDLLAAIVCIAAPTVWSFTLEMLAQPSANIREAGVISLSITAISILIAFIFAFKGRFYREDEVRPVYAKHLAERISMQAEVSAAREAQKRLMPERLPNLRNFSIAACCHPAFEVGGDFYDVFELEPDKLGVLIAEGGGKGLGSALSIAFAKGFLMPKILGDNQADNSPTEVIRGLQDRLAAMLDDEAGAQQGIGLAYVVVDANDGTLRYSRVGSHPVVMIANEKSPGQLSLPEEREIKFKSGRRPEADISVIEGSRSLGEGDSVALLTDGIIRNWKNNKTSPGAELSKVLINARRKDSDALQEALNKSVSECSKRARKQELDDDLTVVIINLASGVETAEKENHG